MSPDVQLFISHSSGEDQLAKDAIAALQATLDKSRIEVCEPFIYEEETASRTSAEEHLG